MRPTPSVGECDQALGNVPVQPVDLAQRQLNIGCGLNDAERLVVLETVESTCEFDSH